MFDVLTTATTERIISAVYYALLLIKHRRGVAGHPGLTLQALEAEIPRPEESLVESIIREIETAEGAALAALSEESAARYARLLDDVAERSVEASFGANPKKSERSLQRLRSSWSTIFPRPRALATSTEPELSLRTDDASTLTSAT